ncbi:hypothetical protein Btru_035618 [Bulinus truncatus]|nr:hypothetical protein Btru_035618 [Bulinus truncatus]
MPRPPPPSGFGRSDCPPPHPGTIVWKMLSVIFCIHFLFHVLPTFGQNNVPVISDYTALNNRYLSESLPKDTYIGTIIAYDPDGTKVNYFIEGNGGEYFAIDRNTGNVTLKKLMDFETEIEIKLNIKVIDGDNQVTVREGKVFVNDANDNPPYFTDTAIFRTLPENSLVGIVVSPILVRDRDTSNSAITLSCIRVTPLLNDSCNTFGLNLTKNSNEYWNGSLVLIKALDYETRISYAIRLIAFDGVFNVTNEIHIEIIDINDTPPTWITADPAVIDEELPNGTNIQTVSARDGDITNKHEIYYELIGNNTDIFGINSSSGGIFVKKRIDFDDQNYPKNVPYDVTILAREVIPNNATSFTLGNDSLTTATVTIKITARDINDNAPTFNMRSYDNIFIDENIIAGANVPGLQMTVTDIDSGTFNSFGLFTLNYTSIFGIIPEQDTGSSSATLFVKNSDTIDYESGVRKYVIEVQAIENMVKNPHTGSATVTITVRDVNDITPSFNQTSYNASVSETASAGTFVKLVNAFDPEEGNFGTAGIRYKLYGNIPAHFTINPLTGEVQVAACSGTPGVGPQCIDYEKKKVYSLVVSATDALEDPKIGLTRSVQLIINILDENDVVPGLESSYVRYMYEGETVTINPLIVNATDPDTVGGPVTYQISGDSSGLWQAPTLTDRMGYKYTNITASRAILYTDAPDTQSGAFHFSIIAQDKKYSQSSPVTIYVIDINNNAPVFSPATYIQSIYENTKGDIFVMKVTATDADSYTTGNGQIDFYIQSGALGKFTVKNVTRNNVTGVYTADIYTTADATFNFDIQNLYEMQLYARDKGTPASKFGTATCIVKILDINNRDPRINPLSQSVTVSENEKVGTSVYRILAEDPDANSILKYYFTPDKAIDGTGNAATSTVYDYRTMFRIDENTGDIFVNSTLDRQSVSRITYFVKVLDVAANPVQNGTGSFLVYILEYNDQAPRFELPLYNISLEEEQNINSFVSNLNCQDDDDKIAGYDLIQESPLRPVFFSLIPGSGAMIVNERIDFEQIEKIELIARCTDSGQPQLSNTTRVIVNVININDNIPNFRQPVYRKSILEGTYSGPLNLTVSASDGDKGDFGVVRYKMQDPSVTFTINDTTGEIYFVPNSTFDREKDAFISFQVLAVDSPLNPALSKRSFATKSRDSNH